MTNFKCPYCKSIIIEDLEKLLKESKSNYEECPNCRSLIWRKQLEKYLWKINVVLRNVIENLTVLLLTERNIAIFIL